MSTTETESSHSDEHGILDGSALSLAWGIPFISLLMCISILPTFWPHFWHHHMTTVNLITLLISLTLTLSPLSLKYHHDIHK